MKYKVHVYAVVRIPVDVALPDDEDPKAATEVADVLALGANVANYLRNGAEYAEEVTYYLVDQLDAEGKHVKSFSYDGQGNFRGEG